MNTEISVIEKKIILFIKKYYANQLIKGLIFSLIFFIIITLFILFFEYIMYLSKSKKAILLLIYFISIISFNIYFIILPFIKYIRHKGNLSTININKIIVKHFPEIKDHLWNILELQNKQLNSNYSEELVIASINQKIENVKPFKFSDAINYKENLNFFIVLISIVIIGFSIIIFLPDVISSSGTRLKNYNKNFIKPSLYNFHILNEKLNVGKGDDISISVKIETKENFENVLINFGGNTYLMKNDSLNYFSYLFSTINNSINFSFTINDSESDNYYINVLNKPILNSFNVSITKPNYTYLKDDYFENITEIIVPIGSQCKFSFNTFETDTLIINSKNNKKLLFDSFEYDINIKEDTEFFVSLKNSNFIIQEYLKINIRIINDQYPSIQVQQLIDSTDFTKIYFKGNIEDDYGFNSLALNIKMNEEIDTFYNIQIQNNLLKQDFFYAFDFNIYKNLNSKVDYYFEIFDNDAINGSKSSVSEYFTFVFPDTKEIKDFQENQFNSIEEIISESLNLTQKLKKDLGDLREKLINSELTEYQKRETVKNIYSKKNQLEEALKQLQDKNSELNNFMESFSEQDNEIVQKQNELQQLLEELMSDEMKALMEELNKMMNQFNQEKMNDLSEKMDISLDDLSEQLDKNLEMLKRMKIEQQMDLINQDLQKHIEEQQKLSDQIDSGKKPEELIEQQKEEKEALDNLEQQYNKIQKENNELEDKLNLFDFKNDFKKIDNEFQNSLDNQKDNKKKKSQQSMQNNKSNMKNMAFMMQQMIKSAESEQNYENINDLLQILDNLIVFSFGQEELLKRHISQNFENEIIFKQKKLYTDFKVIKDSLYALAKREPSLNTTVNKEIVSIETNFSQIDNDLTDNRLNQAKVNQQVVLTSTNNLALFLSEIIKRLQQQMANSKPGNQNCNKPGNNPNPNSQSNSMKSMQESLQKQLEKMMQMMKDGKNGKPLNGEMGKALSQQEMMQNMLQKMMNQGNIGSDATETLKKAEELLNKVREDILRNNISNQTLNRHKEILTRLLEAENAENERNIEEKRKSNTAEDQKISETAKYFDNTNSNDKFEERLIKQKLNLKRFYQNKYQRYINQLDSINGSLN